MPDAYPSDVTGNEAIGIFGGAFDPVHNAHLSLARTVRDRLGISRVRWIPDGQPPHRAPPCASPAHRLAMVQAAIADEPGFDLDESQIANTSACYAVHTLERLRAQFGPDRPLVWLMGADAFLGLTGWFRWRDIFELAHLAVATRPGFPLDAASLARNALPLRGILARRRLAGTDFSGPSGGIACFELSAGTVSATEVRALIAAGATDLRLPTLLPAPVLDYIHRHKLYTA